MYRLAIGLAFLLIVRVSIARDYCIASVDDFNAAVATINTMTGPHYMKIVAGKYELSNVSFGSNGELTLEGGYAPNCVDHIAGAQTTSLEGDPAEDFPPSFHSFSGDLTLRDVTLRGFPGVFVWPMGANANLALERVAILSRSLPPLGDVAIFPDDGSVRMDDVVIDGTTTACAINVQALGAGRSVELRYVTVRNRGIGNGACVTSSATRAQNSIFQADSGVDVVADGAAISLSSSMYQSLTGLLDQGSSNNIQDQAVFLATANDLLRNSLADSQQAARDSATSIPDIALDILGETRQAGSAPDRGAFETQTPACDKIFLHSFENSPCTRMGHSHHVRRCGFGMDCL